MVYEEAPDRERSVDAPGRPRILLVVASRHGGTTEIAGVLAQELVGHDFTAVVADVEHVPDLAAFDGVIVGSAVYLGRWLKPARRLIEDRSSELASSKVWLFSSGPLGDNRESGLDADHVQWLTRTTGAVEHREFGGRLAREELGPIESLVVRAVDAPVGDFRDWDEIRSWARGIVAAFTHA